MNIYNRCIVLWLSVAERVNPPPFGLSFFAGGEREGERND